jgi:hypothetical protein
LKTSEQKKVAERVPPVVISLRPAYVDALRRCAAELRMGEAEAAAHLLSIALEPTLATPLAQQANAERRILAIAEDIARRKAAAGEWDEHLTLSVFGEIEANHLKLYNEACTGDQQRQLNRRIGRRIKEAVGAEVQVDGNGKPVVAHAPRSGQKLIRRYTLLSRP